MANVNRPNGALAVGTSLGSPYSGTGTRRYVDSSNATAIRINDFIILEDDGNVAPYTGTGGGNLLGVCIGVEVDRSIAKTEYPGYLPASTAGYIYVEEDPFVLYEVQADSTLAATAVGSNIDVKATAGSDTTGQSAHELLVSSLTDASPGSAQLLIVAPVDRPDNDISSANSRWLVRINEGVYLSTTGL